ncbi:hypothetical protein ACHAXN_003615 [Cyclotella atomus]
MAYWIEEQNRNCRQLKAGKLLDESLVHQQIAVLESIQFPFERSRPERRDANLEALREFYKGNGHLKILQVPKADLGSIWLNFAWADKFNLLVQWKEQHLHCKVPRTENVLGKWVADQRVKKKKDKLTDDQVEKLNDIGFLWTGR